MDQQRKAVHGNREDQELDGRQDRELPWLRKSGDKIRSVESDKVKKQQHAEPYQNVWLDIKAGGGKDDTRGHGAGYSNDKKCILIILAQAFSAAVSFR